MNTYIIPKESRSDTEYFDFVSSLTIVFNGDRSLSINPSTEEVTVDGTIAGYTAI